MVLPEGGPPRLEVCRVGRLGGGQRRGEAPAPAVVCEPASLFALLVLLVGAVPGVGGDREGVAGGEAETDLVKGGPFEVCFFFLEFYKKIRGKKSERESSKEREGKKKKKVNLKNSPWFPATSAGGAPKLSASTAAAPRNALACSKQGGVPGANDEAPRSPSWTSLDTVLGGLPPFASFSLASSALSLSTRASCSWAFVKTGSSLGS